MKQLTIISLFFFFTVGLQAQMVPSTETILDAAYKQAVKEKKNVFVIFHASWCGWCKKMDASMNDASIKKYFDENYVTVHLTVQETDQNKKLENPGAASFLSTYKGASAGLPFFLILDKTGKLIGDSFGKDGNIGCPANKEEVDYFLSLLKKSSKINAEGLELIKVRFRQNEAH